MIVTIKFIEASEKSYTTSNNETKSFIEAVVENTEDNFALKRDKFLVNFFGNLCVKAADLVGATVKAQLYFNVRDTNNGKKYQQISGILPTAYYYNK